MVFESNECFSGFFAFVFLAFNSAYTHKTSACQLLSFTTQKKSQSKKVHSHSLLQHRTYVFFVAALVQ